MSGVATARGTGLKGCSVGKVENRFSNPCLPYLQDAESALAS